MIISWFEKRVRRNANNLFSVVHDNASPPKKGRMQWTELSYLPEPVQDRIARLRDWRKGISSQRGWPQYRIFDNKTLLHLAVKNPQSLEELEQIPGIKEKRKNDFGLVILELLKTQPHP